MSWATSLILAEEIKLLLKLPLFINQKTLIMLMIFFSTIIRKHGPHATYVVLGSFLVTPVALLVQGLYRRARVARMCNISREPYFYAEKHFKSKLFGIFKNSFIVVFIWRGLEDHSAQNSKHRLIWRSVQTRYKKTNKQKTKTINWATRGKKSRATRKFQ